MTFTGFSRDTITFLRELEASNTKVFFDANKERFERVWVRPACDLVVAVGAALERLAPSIEYEPRLGGSLMRMNRDVRFSKDKSPYKTHLDLFFWEGAEKGWGRPGFFFRLTARELMCGAGMHVLEKEQLARYRAAVDDERRGRALAKLVAGLRADGAEVGREDYKKVPKGYAADHPRAELLRFGALYAAFSSPVPSELTKPALVDVVVSRFEATSPLRSWLSDTLA